MSTRLAEHLFAQAGLRLHGHHSHGHQPPLTHDPPHAHGQGWWPAGTGPFRPGPGAPTFGARMPETHRPGVVTGPTGQRHYNTTGGDYGWQGRNTDLFDLPPNVGTRVPESHRPGVRRQPTGEYAYNTTGGDYGWEGRRTDRFGLPPNVGSSQRWRAVTRLGHANAGIGCGIGAVDRLMPSLAAKAGGRMAMVGLGGPIAAQAAAVVPPNKRVSLSPAQSAQLKALMIAAMAGSGGTTGVSRPSGGPTWAQLVAAGKAKPLGAARLSSMSSALGLRGRIAVDPSQQAALDAAQERVALAEQQALFQYVQSRRPTSKPSGGGPSSRDSTNQPAPPGASLNLTGPSVSVDPSGVNVQPPGASASLNL